ncbi:hypothetical protein [Saccharothrix texasensis]|uniref:Uncharacterized protein n=1 Tax=Saccharothrix texasensis TaxID=103734 RepID=A0A3N1HA01_9PSEU|nr:hypothetical protein [Saccharothrix texasensis]ROP39256.1 hypothetical protein EDD40_4636 [Saccharothrix texasensis]
MSWQEDLAELDRTLAEGRISADDYRRRRDELLAAASGGGPAAPPNSGPFAPPVRWDAVPPSPPNQNPDATQIVTPGAQQANPDRTQVVSQRPADADRTQYVTPIAPPQHQMPPPPQQQQQGGWQSGPPSSTPPWGGDNYSPIGDANPSWIAQGPEVFDDSGSGKGKVIGIVVAVVLLAGIAFGAYWIWGRGESSSTAGGNTTETTATTTTTSQPPPDPLPLGEIPGKVATNKAVTDFTAVPNLKYLLDSEAALYTTAGATKTKLTQFTLDDGSKGIILIVQGTDAASAAAAVLGLHNTQINNGMTQVTDGPAGVLAGQIDAKDPQLARVRGHYSSKDLIIRVDVASSTLTAARKGFDEALEAELEVLAADG